MRKILTSVLSVAGLLAVVLALASSPASAAKQVITIQVGADASTDNAAGTYTVSWETQGGCDPGSGSSGASGSVTLTVAGAGTDRTTGNSVETGVVTDDICQYTWKATFTNAAGANCVVGEGTSGADPLSTGTDNNITLTTGACVVTGKIEVTVRGHDGIYVGDCIEKGTGTGTHDNDDCSTANTNDPQDGTHRQAVADDTTEEAAKARAKTAAPEDEQRNVGAVANTVFTVTATPEKGANNKVPEGCMAVSKDTEIVHDTGGLQRVTLTVVDLPLGVAVDAATGQCTYTVSAALPAGFAAGGGEARSKANQATKVNPDDDGADNDAGTGCGTDAATGGCTDNGPVKSNLTVSVAAVKVYLVQNVVGDAGGAAATYKLDTPCGAPGLPAALTARADSGGITTVRSTNVVELRTGRYNITAALADNPAAEGAADGVNRHAIAEDGKACDATVSVSGVPAHCSAEGVSTSLASATGSVILEVTVDCSPPPAPEPMDDDMGSDDMGSDDMGADDMGADDMGADDMGSDDMGSDDMGSDDMDDMGPPADTPTG